MFSTIATVWLAPEIGDKFYFSQLMNRFYFYCAFISIKKMSY